MSKKLTLSTLTVLFCLIILSGFGSMKNPVNYVANVQTFIDTPKPKSYTLTYERNNLYVNLDSLNAIGRQYIGSSLTKDQFSEVINIYTRVLFRIVNSGKLDSLIIKK